MSQLWVHIASPSLRDNCQGTPNRLHHPAEDTIRALVTVANGAGDHSVFVLYKCGWLEHRFPVPPGGLEIGRHYRPDELEPIPEPP